MKSYTLKKIFNLLILLPVSVFSQANIDFSNINLVIVEYQREIELEWEKPQTSEAVIWRITVNKSDVYDIGEKTNFIVSGLEPNSKYEIKIEAIVGSKAYDVAREDIFTEFMLKDKDDLSRIPHLRKIHRYADVSELIDLFYIDLYNGNADISYFIDDEQVYPIDKTLYFTKTGKQRLKIIIIEDEQHTWELEYIINVKRIRK